MQLYFILGLRLWGEEGRGTKKDTQLPRGKEKKSREKEGLGSWGRVGEEGKETVLFLVQCGGYRHPPGLELNKTGDLHPRLELGRAHEGQHLHEETPCTPTSRRGLGTSLDSTSWAAFQWIRVKESVLVCYTCRSDESQTGRLKQQTSFVFWRLEVLDQGVGRVGLIPPEGCQSVYCLSPGSLWFASHLWHSLACRSLSSSRDVLPLCVCMCIQFPLWEWQSCWVSQLLWYDLILTNYVCNGLISSKVNFDILEITVMTSIWIGGIPIQSIAELSQKTFTVAGDLILTSVLKLALWKTKKINDLQNANFRAHFSVILLFRTVPSL